MGSLPLRKRGLKYNHLCRDNLHLFVASFAEAWIEIFVLGSAKPVRRCRFLCGSVDWNQLHLICFMKIQVASFAEAWIEIQFKGYGENIVSGRFLCGSVDWNLCICNKLNSLSVASFAEAWIEIRAINDIKEADKVASFAEAWIEIQYWQSL